MSGELTIYNKREEFSGLDGAIQTIRKFCVAHKIPAFMAFAVGNSLIETDYETTLIGSLSNGINLTNDLFPKFIGATLGFRLTFPHEMNSIAAMEELSSMGKIQKDGTIADQTGTTKSDIVQKADHRTRERTDGAVEVDPKEYLARKRKKKETDAGQGVSYPRMPVKDGPDTGDQATDGPEDQEDKASSAATDSFGHKTDKTHKKMASTEKYDPDIVSIMLDENEEKTGQGRQGGDGSEQADPSEKTKVTKEKRTRKKSKAAKKPTDDPASQGKEDVMDVMGNADGVDIAIGAEGAGPASIDDGCGDTTDMPAAVMTTMMADEEDEQEDEQEYGLDLLGQEGWLDDVIDVSDNIFMK